MDLVNLSLSNFKSFVGNHTFDFSGVGPGFHFIGGDNRLEPHLGANGAGKSSLLDGLFWGLYGKSMRGLRSPDMHTWDSDGSTGVTIDFLHQGNEYKLVRTWSPNTLTLRTDDSEAQVVTQGHLESIIGLSAEAFQNSVIIGQFTPMFLDMKPSEKLDIFTDLLDLDYWIEKSKEAHEKKTTHQEEIVKIKLTCSNLEGQVKTIKDNRIKNITSSKSFEKKRRSKIDNLKKELKGQKKELKKSEEINDRHKRVLENVMGRHAELNAKINSLNIKIKKHTSDNQEEKDQQTALLERGKIKKESIEHFENLSGTSCPECEQKVSKAHSNKHILKFTKDLKKLNNKNIEFRRIIDGINGLIENLKLKRTGHQEKLDRVGEDRNSAHIGLASESRNIDRYKAFIREYDKDLVIQENETNPYQDLIAQADIDIDILKETLGKRKRKFKSLEKLSEAYDYWHGAFRDIRLFVVEKALIAFEIEINSSLTQLGLEDWTIKLDVERELKSGKGVARGFTVLIESPYNADPVPWESWSGGEGQRLRLAGTLALANLIRSMRGFESDLEIYDEPTAHLSEDGILDLLNLLHQRAHNEDRCIWMIDHHSIDFGFDTITTVVKDENGSRIEQ